MRVEPASFFALLLEGLDIFVGAKRIGDEEMLAAAIDQVQRVRILDDFFQSTGQGTRIARQLSRRVVRQEFSFSRHGKLKEPGRDRGQDRKNNRDDNDNDLKISTAF